MLSIDVEDWFQVENLRGQIHRGTWNDRELRVRRSTERLIEIFADADVKATFFVLGWVASVCPEVVRSISEEGHEIASHGHSHTLINAMSKRDFEEDITKSKKLLEDISGSEVIGYRAPSFSITNWAIPLLKKAGYVYDSSYFRTAYHDRYGSIDIPTSDSLVVELAESFYEVSIPALEALNRPIPWGGGGYFRFYPYKLFRFGARQILKKSGDFLFYLHPWEIDHLQPRVRNISKMYYFRHYYGLRRTEVKLIKLLKDFDFEPIRTVLAAKTEGIKSICSV